MSIRVGGVLGMFDASETLASTSGMVRLEELIVALEARVSDIEKRLAAGFPQGVSITTGGALTPRYCPKCGRHMTVKPTGNILTSMPPKTEMKCSACQHIWGHREGVR
jgi:ribosomal protein L33